MSGPVQGLLPQLAALPVIVPLLMGCALLLLRGRQRLTDVLALLSMTSLLAAAIVLLQHTAGGATIQYAMGNWPAPFGIATYVDRLTALMLTVTAVMGLACHLAAGRDTGSRFPALLQFQLAGLNGAFLTGDLFNLFVFFEVLLAASYALLLDRQDGERLRRGLHYVTVNLLGSGLFLIAAAMFYGIAGTLNIADLDARLATLPASDLALARTAGLLLLIVFAIKAAALPLGLWLPGTYGAARAHVAALFAIMTKVGIYAIARVHGALFEPASAQTAGAEPLAGLALPWLLAVGPATLLLGAFGTLAARDLRVLVAWLVVGSAGTLLTALGLGTPAAGAAALFYLPHSTFAAGAAFLVVELIARGRAGSNETRPEHYLVTSPLRTRGAAWTGTLFFIAALVIAGLPPGSGFIAKALVLDAARDVPSHAWVWAVILGSSLVTLIALARVASAVFWKPVAQCPVEGWTDVAPRSDGVLAASWWLIGWGLALVLLARTLHLFVLDAASALGGT
jgi:multicomponent K+:H+ antiporter subunit D